MSYFTYNTKKIYYKDTKIGTPLLLLHGNSASSEMLKPLIPLLSDKYRVIVMDFLGCGHSERIETWPEDLWYNWSEQAISLCNYLQLENVNVIGCSGGALVAINMALSFPIFINAIIADSFEGIKADKKLTEQIRLGRDYAKQNAGFCSMLETMHGNDWESVLDADTQAIINHSEHIENFFHLPLTKLNRRMLLVGSKEDEMFPKNHYENLFEEICVKTPYASKHIFEHGTHPAIMSNMKEFVDLCEKFFAKN